jgi:hypothetical protein
MPEVSGISQCIIITIIINILIMCTYHATIQTLQFGENREEEGEEEEGLQNDDDNRSIYL